MFKTLGIQSTELLPSSSSSSSSFLSGDVATVRNNTPHMRTGGVAV